MTPTGRMHTFQLRSSRRNAEDAVFPPNGSKETLQDLLYDYKEANNTVVRKRCWVMTGSGLLSEKNHWYWRFRKHFVTKVVDKSDPQDGLRKCFTIALSD